MRTALLPLLLAMSLAAAAPTPRAGAAEAEETPRATWVVGIKPAAPVTMKAEDGTWDGITVALWREIADALKIETEFREMDLTGLFEAVGDGRVDAALGALTVTAGRETLCDFTHPFHSAGLAVAVKKRERGGLLAILGLLASREFLQILLVLVTVLFAAGLLVWLFERRRNEEQFGGKTSRALGAAFWWAAVTMTTVGYGDKAPQTPGGRVVALVWMFVSLVIISGFVAGITAALTVSRLETRIQSVEDLAHVRSGATKGSTGEAFLHKRRYPGRTYPDADAALDALQAGEVEAVVYDRPLLQHRIAKRRLDTITILPHRLSREDYAIALKAGHADRERINRVLLEVTKSEAWEAVLGRYLAE